MSAKRETLVLSRPLWESYLNSLKGNDLKAETIRVYRRCMEELYDFLPKDKEITENTLEDWKLYLKDCGYSENSINLRISAGNGFLKFCGMKEYTTAHERITRDGNMPEMTRAEYLQFLSAVRRIATEQEYLLIKVFALADVRIHELQYLTIESCREGAVNMPDGRVSLIPSCLGKELISYAEKRDIRSGAIFVTRSGNMIDRSNIARAIRNLAIDAGMEPEKCSPRALHRMYLTTQQELRRRIIPIYLQTYDNLLNTEQAVVAWQ